MSNDTEDKRRLELLGDTFKRLLGPEGDALAAPLLPWLVWREVAGGATVFRRGEDAGEMYFVVSGRLRASASADDQTAGAREIPRGQTAGELEFMTGAERGENVIAVRDCLLASLSRKAYEELARCDPGLSMSLTRLLAGRLSRLIVPPRRTSRPTNICLLPLDEGVDVSSLAYSLARQLSFGGRALVVAHDSPKQGSGPDGDGFSDDENRQLAEWLDDVESRHDFLIFVADVRPNEWTRRCARESDELLLVAHADSTPDTRVLETALGGGDVGFAARRTLVLLHGEGERIPRATRPWLDCLTVAAHLHIRPALDRDIGRLARLLSGNAVGLVLSGGGARGFAHLGVIKALEEFGIPIDMIGGSSIGAIMGAYCAFDLPAREIIALAREAFSRRPTGDVNLIPIISLIGGMRLRRVIDDAVLSATGAQIDVEDTWKSFFCVVSNYTRAAETQVRRGNLAKWLRTSVSIPGVLPLVPHAGELMGDGGSFNNFPTDVMRRQVVGTVIGSDLLKRGFDLVDVDEVPRNWQLIADRLHLFGRRRYRLPKLTTTLVSATMLVSQARQREARQCADLCFTPEMGGIGMLDWGKFDAIVELGYRHARAVLWSLPESELTRLRAGSTIPAGDDSPANHWNDELFIP